MARIAKDGLENLSRADGIPQHPRHEPKGTYASRLCGEFVVASYEVVGVYCRRRRLEHLVQVFAGERKRRRGRVGVDVIEQLRKLCFQFGSR